MFLTLRYTLCLSDLWLLHENTFKKILFEHLISETIYNWNFLLSFWILYPFPTDADNDMAVRIQHCATVFFIILQEISLDDVFSVPIPGVVYPCQTQTRSDLINFQKNKKIKLDSYFTDIDIFHFKFDF